MEILPFILSILVGALVLGLVLMVVSRLGLGLHVSGFGPAFIAAIVIAVISAIVIWLLGVLGITITGGLLGAIVWLVIAAIVLLLADRFVKGMEVKGFTGALIAAIAIAVLYWIITWIIGLLV